MSKPITVIFLYISSKLSFLALLFYNGNFDSENSILDFQIVEEWSQYGYFVLDFVK